MPELSHECPNTTGTWASSMKVWVTIQLCLYPRQQQSLNVSVAASNSPLCRTGVQRNLFLESVQMSNVVFQVTGMLEKQSDNSGDAWGPVPPIPSDFDVKALSMLGATSNFSQNFTTSRCTAMFQKPWMKEVIPQRILQNNWFLNPWITENLLPRRG